MGIELVVIVAPDLTRLDSGWGHSGVGGGGLPGQRAEAPPDAR